MAIEAACTKLGQQDVEELRTEINSLKVFPPLKPNLTKAQSQAIRELKRDRDCIVLNSRQRGGNGHNVYTGLYKQI